MYTPLLIINYQIFYSLVFMISNTSYYALVTPLYHFEILMDSRVGLLSGFGWIILIKSSLNS